MEYYSAFTVLLKNYLNPWIQASRWTLHNLSAWSPPLWLSGVFSNLSTNNTVAIHCPYVKDLLKAQVSHDSTNDRLIQHSNCMTNKSFTSVYKIKCIPNMHKRKLTLLVSKLDMKPYYKTHWSWWMQFGFSRSECNQLNIRYSFVL